MDTLSVAIVDTVDENDGVYVGAQLLVNGVSLVDLVRQAELPMAQQEGSPGLAGQYSWCYGTRTYMTDLRRGSKDPEDFIPMLQCPCGEPACWPLYAWIEVGEETVTWHSFYQRHRQAGSSDKPWDYSGFGPFTFDRKQYERALQTVLKAFE